MEKKKLLNIILLFLCLLLLTFSTYSCSILNTKNLDPLPAWSYEPQAIRIRYNAEKTLNYFNEKPHALVLKIYQLKSVDPFNNLAKNETGLKKLLREEHFDPSVVRVDKVIVQPGEDNVLILDRGEDVKWVCVVTGYYTLVPGQVNQAYKIPVTVETTGKIRKKKIAQIRPLNIILYA